MQDIDEVLSLSPEKMLLRWMNHHLKKAGYKKTVNNFSSDVKVHMKKNASVYQTLVYVPLDLSYRCPLSYIDKLKMVMQHLLKTTLLYYIPYLDAATILSDIGVRESVSDHA